MEHRTLKIGITSGDPAGIGPEVALKAINSHKDKKIIPILIGRHSILQKLYSELYKDYTIIDPDTAKCKFSTDKKYLYNVHNELPVPVPVPGQGDVNTGSESKMYIDKAISLWQSGHIDAIVTGPVNKGLIEEAGTSFSGHTEYIAQQINENKPYMMMFSSEYRVLLATTHIPVSNIPESINRERLLDVIRIGNDSIQAIDGDGIKIAITGLDPHCGDNGAIGNFDKDVTLQAIESAKKEGINIEGPFAADTLFIADRWKKYNLVIAHYHDQGLIPFKLLAFDNGVNVTLGLSVVRTSVDHGTAYDIAGKGIAKYSSMVEAIKLAHSLVSNRRE